MESGIDLEAQLRRGLSHSEGEFLRMDEKEFNLLKAHQKYDGFAKLSDIGGAIRAGASDTLTDGRLEELTLVVGREASPEDGGGER